VSDWATDNPELSIPIGVIGAPVALATIPMIISYTLFPLASGAGYLMPEATEDSILFKIYYIVHFINPKSNHPALLG
jgi:hypothetical protein